MTPSEQAPDGTGIDDLAAALDFTAPAPRRWDEDPADEARTAEPGFTVENPPGTVAVTTYGDGRVAHVALTGEVTRLTEAELADEVLVVASLATQQARAAQYSTMLAQLRADGHEETAITGLLVHGLGLPSQHVADAALAAEFSRYDGHHYGVDGDVATWGDRYE